MKLRATRSNNAPKLISLLKQQEKDLGIYPNITNVYNSLQNRVIERSIQTLEDAIRAMIKESRMLIDFWLEVLTT